MSDIAIRVEGLGKRYRLGQQVGYKTLRETFFLAYHTPTRILGQRVRRMRWTEDRGPKTEVAGLPSPVPSPQSPVSGPQSPVPSQSDHIWALKDVSFEVNRGEAVGIIGRNGSGKSTLLKILSRITAPTEGCVEVHGRLGSLLEVGTGFHPELTGRENIYLNGAVIGMKRAEVNRKFDEIVAFAEIEKFLDTPVKRYSSGMYVRLAFAVAAHLEPEILIVDEVLAVGDAQFQKKCLGKMGDVAREGRTVLFVSHNMSAIRQLCPRSMLLENGRILQAGPASEVIDSYLQSTGGQAKTAKRTFADDPDKEFQLLSATLMTDKGFVTQSFTCDGPVVIDLVCKVRRPVPGLYGYLLISRTEGTQVMESDSYDAAPNPLDGLPAGTYSARVTLPARTLASGDYDVYFNFTSISGSKRSDYSVDSPGVVGSFHLDDSSSRRGNRRGGFFSTTLPWEVAPLETTLAIIHRQVPD